MNYLSEDYIIDSKQVSSVKKVWSVFVLMVALILSIPKKWYTEVIEVDKDSIEQRCSPNMYICSVNTNNSFSTCICWEWITNKTIKLLWWTINDMEIFHREPIYWKVFFIVNIK